MIVNIDDNTRIKGTSYCWELQSHRPYKGGMKWEPYKYFPSFRQAVAAAVHREIRVHPAHGLSEAILAVADTVDKYEKLIPSEYRLSK